MKTAKNVHDPPRESGRQGRLDGEAAGRRRNEEMEDAKLTDRLNFFLNPHAPYSCGKEYLKMVAEVAKENNYGIHIHLAEGQVEMDIDKYDLFQEVSREKV